MGDLWDREWFDYYAVLHLGFSASPAQIAAARRTLAGKHNARLGVKPNQDQMRQINIAYNTLFDPAARKRYDAAYLSRHPHLRPSQDASPPNKNAPRPRSHPAPQHVVTTILPSRSFKLPVFFAIVILLAVAYMLLSR